jgi:uncharacterized protein
MSAPLPLALAAGSPGALAVAFAIGVGFGWCLERAGLGSARKLMGQFHLTDLAVFKVMFSAILTAMLGLFWLSRFGVVDLSRVYVPETFVGPQLAGGVIFGAGMALAGLCPGTSCVAAATGRVDGIAVVAGFFAGILTTALALPTIALFYGSGARGGVTLDSVLDTSQGVMILVVVTIAMAGFVAADRIERLMARSVAEAEP